MQMHINILKKLIDEGEFLPARIISKDLATSVCTCSRYCNELHRKGLLNKETFRNKIKINNKWVMRFPNQVGKARKNLVCFRIKDEGIKYYEKYKDAFRKPQDSMIQRIREDLLKQATIEFNEFKRYYKTIEMAYRTIYKLRKEGLIEVVRLNGKERGNIAFIVSKVYREKYAL